jgi:hypothetical protein
MSYVDKIINVVEGITVGRVLSALRLRPQTRDAKRAVSTVAQMGGELSFLIAASGGGSVKWKGEM